MAARKSNRETSQPAANLNSVVCYKCGKRGHFFSVCNLESKPCRCVACSGFGHISRNCFSRQPQQFQSQLQKPNQKSSNAVESAGVGAPQVLTKAIIDSVHVHEALVDTGSAVSMLNTALYAKLPSKPPTQPFKKPATDIVGVGGASAEVKGYVNVPLQLSC